MSIYICDYLKAHSNFASMSVYFRNVIKCKCKEWVLYPFSASISMFPVDTILKSYANADVNANVEAKCEVQFFGIEEYNSLKIGFVPTFAIAIAVVIPIH